MPEAAQPFAPQPQKTLLDLRCVSIRYGERRVLDEVSLTLAAGASLGIAGESGSGKSQLALALMGLLPPAATVGGEWWFGRQNLQTLGSGARRRLRGAQMALVFQDPMTSLNPYLTVGVQLSEMLELHRGASRPAARAAALRMLDAMRVRDAAGVLGQYPHALSGGLRQRVMIAMMLLAEPALLIADEPTTALDVTVQAEILRLLHGLRRELGLTLIMISHDLGVLAAITERLLLLYAGTVLEQGATADVLAAPAHPYTQALLACRPTLQSPLGRPLPSIPGQLPAAGARPAGCVFAPRCGQRSSPCDEVQPLRATGSPPRLVRCWQLAT